jgi:hypothetical protein
MGDWVFNELAPLNVNAGETAHDFAIVTATTKLVHNETREQVWVALAILVATPLYLPARTAQQGKVG